VAKEDLLNLLMDHSRAIGLLYDAGVTVEENYAACDQVRKDRAGR
jgi:hypothetical protein